MTCQSRRHFRLLPDIPEIGWTPYLWLVYVVFFFLEPATSHPGSREWAATAIATLLFLVLYFRGYWLKGIDLLPVVLGEVLLGALFLPFNLGAAVFFIYAAGSLGFVGPPRVALRWLLAVVGLAILESWLLRLPFFNAMPAVLMSLIVGAANIHFAEAHRNDRRLQLAQDEVERLAKLAERERIARDLHDLLGHTLSLITLKSELAGRLLPRDAAAAAVEIRDVERISRETLGEVRRAVQGYREGGLAAELAGCRLALEAAGVAVTADIEPLRLLPSAEGVLALALREAVTNVVRHAEARNCHLELVQLDGSAVLTVRDDGRGGLTAEGMGLTGMRERATALGGGLERDGRDGTTLRLQLPLSRATVAGAQSPSTISLPALTAPGLRAAGG